MNLEKRINTLEKILMSSVREKLVMFRAKNKAEFDKQCEQYLKSNPEPEVFLCIVDFSDLFEIYGNGGNPDDWSFENGICENSTPSGKSQSSNGR